MKIGITYDLKESVPVGQNEPDDTLEEYDSRETIDGIAAALKSAGHTVQKMGGGRAFLRAVLRAKVDFVFNIAEGLGTYRSREAQVPSVLEMLGIPYSGSDPQSLAVCHDKHLAKKIVSLAGVSTPKWHLVSSLSELAGIEWAGFPFPAFVKPAYEGSSMGVRLTSRVEKAGGLQDAVGKLLKSYEQPVIVEEFIDGDEVTVGVIGNSPTKVLGIMRVLPRAKMLYFVYSLEIKRDWEKLVDYECPARLPEGTLKQISDFALRVFKSLGCRDFARLDFRVSRARKPYFLEINPLPGLNPQSSDYPIMAYKMGWGYNGLVNSILSAGLERYAGAADHNRSL
ncbi:MAG: ATP-grasp domain-containing protein [Chloroflexota bacterium]